MRCHEVDYELFGDDMQIVEVELTVHFSLCPYFS